MAIRTRITTQYTLSGLLASGILLTGGLASQAAVADVTAVFDASEGSVTIEYRDDDHVRLLSSENTYFVIREGKGYIVNQERGESQVIALDNMAAMTGFMRGAAEPEPETERDTGNFRLTDTGRSETVAGIRGEVYEYAERDSRTADWQIGEEIVLSDDADARAAYRGLTRITELLGEMAGQQGLDGKPDDILVELKDKAVLRYGNEWRLASIDRQSIPDSNFTLPAEPMTMPGAGGFDSGFRGGQPEGRSGQESGIGKEVRELGQVAADEAEASSDEIREETRRGITEGVREGVREGFRGLFGR